MNNFFIVFKFELMGYIKKKSYIISTLILSLIVIIGMAIPRLFLNSSLNSESSGADKNKEKSVIAVYDASNENVLNMDYLKSFFDKTDIKLCSSKDEIEKLVKSEDVEAGFIVDSPNSYQYFVNNKGFSDYNQQTFESALSKMYRDKKMIDMGLNPNDIESIYSLNMESTVNILGKDATSSFGYTYVYIMFLYMVVLIYGQMIATSVTVEKSSRAMELLVTSTSSNSLIFGKVIGTVVATIIQVCIVFICAVISFEINKSALNDILTSIVQVPLNVIISFFVFGILGYVFYAFIFGTLGALVSKPEDLGSSLSSITIIYVVVFFAVLFGLQNPNNNLMTILSFIPFSSFMAMPVRIAMSGVGIVQVILSFIILLVSTILLGMLASKIYRRATLMYGNPIKIKNALKWIKDK